MKNVDHVFCQIFQLWRFRLVCLWQLIILFPPAKEDYNNSVQFNAFASKASTSAEIAGTPVMILNFLLTVLSELHFRIFADWLTLSIFFERGPHKWISLGPRISCIRPCWGLSMPNEDLNPLNRMEAQEHNCFYHRSVFCAVMFFSLLLKLRYRDIVTVCRKNWMEEQGSSL